MLMTRSTAVTAGIAAAAALAATGITYASAASVPAQVAPAQAPFGGSGKGNEGNEGNEGRGKGFEEEGLIHINERSYSAHPGGCITVVSGLGAKSLNIRNDTRRTVEVFRGAVCDNGAPIATVGPHSSSDGVNPRSNDGFFDEEAVVGSFRVVKDRDGKF
ncbi:hypothetical protein [Streptomyces sp. NPDC001508]|uniref:hypothetical protein n=1 Tax=Streptomyces sp. NPDC001508 TaxID=3154656 RepID=UPI0033211BF2